MLSATNETLRPGKSDSSTMRNLGQCPAPMLDHLRHLDSWELVSALSGHTSSTTS